MDYPAIKEHFRNPRNRRLMADADGTGSGGDEGCGARIEVNIRFSGDAISEAAFTASGSSAIIAAGSIMTEMLAGLVWKQAAALSVAAMAGVLTGEKVVTGLSSKHINQNAAERRGSPAQAAFFAIEALHGALEDSLRRRTFPVAVEADGNSVIVAMSGGVDSSVASVLLMRAGRDVTGVTMRLWSDPGCAGQDASPSCCSPESIIAARDVCHSLGLPHLTVDYTDAFERSVVRYFISEYLLGRTPNPCTFCNGRFRFAALADLATWLGASKVATGHYARLVERDGKLLIARGSDPAKDQSYMLWDLESSLLRTVEFPLGGMYKSQTRDLAYQTGLVVHDRTESQEVCFIPDNDYRRFLTARLDADGSKPFPAGDIVDRNGNVLGRHTGYINYTVGQRRGLGVSAPEPLYVIRTDPAGNRVIAGSREDLAVSSLEIDSVNAFLPPDGDDSTMVQVRYNSAPIGVRVYEVSEGSAGPKDRKSGIIWKLKLDQPAFGVAPGQSAVLYRQDAVVAGGVIRSAE